MRIAGLADQFLRVLGGTTRQIVFMCCGPLKITVPVLTYRTQNSANSGLCNQGNAVLTSKTMKRVLYVAAMAFAVLTSTAQAVTDPVNVPEGGVTVALLSMAVGGLVLLHRKL